MRLTHETHTIFKEFVKKSGPIRNHCFCDTNSTSRGKNYLQQQTRYTGANDLSVVILSTDHSYVKADSLLLPGEKKSSFRLLKDVSSKRNLQVKKHATSTKIYQKKIFFYVIM